MATSGGVPVSTEFLDRLASQLKIGKEPASRRAIERILDITKTGYKNGEYENPVEAERDFRRLVSLQEGDE
jgi:hypothetical protein